MDFFDAREHFRVAFQRHHQTALTRGMVGGHASFTLSDESLDLLAGAVRDTGSSVHIHVAEDRGDVEDCRARYGLDQPLPVKYLHWLQSVLRGELGFSFAYDRPVSSLIWPRARNTLLLTVPATTLAWLIAVP